MRVENASTNTDAKKGQITQEYAYLQHKEQPDGDAENGWYGLLVASWLNVEVDVHSCSKANPVAQKK